MMRVMQMVNGITSQTKRLTCSKVVGGEVDMRSNVIARAKHASLKFSSLPGSIPRYLNSLLAPMRCALKPSRIIGAVSIGNSHWIFPLLIHSRCGEFQKTPLTQPNLHILCGLIKLLVAVYREGAGEVGKLER